MKRLFALLIVAASCAAPVGNDEATTSAAATSPDPTDPVDHLRVIASPEMDGRGTPSSGLDRAIGYVVSECQRAGLTGGIGEGVYEQPFTVEGSTVNNVLAMHPGAGAHATEVVLMSAHLDHLGHGYPGADDNGSGSATLLAMANRLAGHVLDRSVGFLWTVGEEKGLLGSAYFADHPPAALPLSRIVQVINLDAVGALEDTRFSMLLDDADRTTATAQTMESIGRAMSPPFTKVNRDLQAYTRRQDGYSFVRHHVPTVWAFEGLTNPNGGGSLMARYHRPTDTLDALLAENGGSKIRRMTTMLTSTVEALANADAVAH